MKKSRVLVGRPAEEHPYVTRRKSHRVVEELVSYQELERSRAFKPEVRRGQDKPLPNPKHDIGPESVEALSLRRSA